MKVIVIPATILIMSFVCCFLAYAYVIQFALWLGVIASFVLAALGILRSHKETDWLLIIAAFALSMRVPSFYQTRPWGFAPPMADSAFDLALSNLIRESGKWNPGIDFEVIKAYSYNPVLHILTAVTASVTGMDTALLARIFPFLAAPVVTTFFYMSLRKILSKEVAIWSSLMYNLNGNWHFWEYFIREFIALIFFSMYLYVIFRMYKIREGRRRFLGLGLITAFMTTSSHHWTSYNLLITLVVLAVFPIVYARVHSWFMDLRVHHKNLITPRLLGITFIVTFSWTLGVAYRIFAIHMHQFMVFFINVIMPSPSFVEHSMGGLTFTMQVLLYFGYLLLGFLGLAELVMQFLKRQKTYDDSIFESWFIFSGVYILVGTFLLPSGGEWWKVSWRSWSFAFFGLVPLGAKTITRIQHWKRKSKLTPHFKWLSNSKRLVPLVLVFPLVSGVLMAPPEIRSPGYPHVGDSFYSTALWVRHYLPNETIALDPWARSVIVPYGRALTFTSLRWPGGYTVFLNALYQSGNSSDFLSPAWEIVVFNRRISDWVPTASADSSVLDQHYNRIYDSESLATYMRAPRYE